MRYDLVVIGTGPGGHGAAIQAAKLGKKVAVVEKHQVVGGSAVNTGTIPSKTFREAAMYLTGYLQREMYGLSYRVKDNITIDDLTFRCEQIIRDSIDVLKDQFARNDVELVFGEASFVQPHRIRVQMADGSYEELEADYFVIATGSTPAHSPNVPVNQNTILDSDGILSLGRIPRRLTVVGAGAIGIEYASVFAILGVKVTLVDMREDILKFIDHEILQALIYNMRQNGVTFRLGEEVTEVVEKGNRVVARTKSRKTIRSGFLLYTVGRVGATEGLNLEALGLEVDRRGRIPVNHHYQSTVEHIYAVGDVIGAPALASTSMEQGRLASSHAFGLPTQVSNELLPIGIYTVPEISLVGQTEETLTRNEVPYEFGVARYRETARGKIIGDPTGMLKLLFHSESRKLLGVHIIGERASELVHIGQVAMATGAGLDFFVDNVFNYPTLAECYKVAALDAFNKLA